MHIKALATQVTGELEFLIPSFKKSIALVIKENHYCGLELEEGGQIKDALQAHQWIRQSADSEKEWMSFCRLKNIGGLFVNTLYV